MDTNIITLFLVSLFFFGFSEYYSKMYAETVSAHYAWFAILASLVSCTFWLSLIRQTNTLIATGIVWTVLGMLIILFLGVLVFDEPLTLYNKVGIIFAFISVILLGI